MTARDTATALRAAGWTSDYHAALGVNLWTDPRNPKGPTLTGEQASKLQATRERMNVDTKEKRRT